MRSIKPKLTAAANAVTLAKLQLKVLMGITADVEIKINDNLTNYETTMFANQLKEEECESEQQYHHEAVGLEHEVARKECKVFKDELFMPTLSMSLLLSISVIV